MFRSKDEGESWSEDKVKINLDEHKRIPQLHMSEKGICINNGRHVGRLIRPARIYDADNNMSNNLSIYSDDNGRTFLASKKFPVTGSGEGAIAELNSGILYYSSRKHFFNDVKKMNYFRHFAYSYDGGQSWQNSNYSKILPDGPRYRGLKPKGASYQGHFGLMAGLAKIENKKYDILLYSNVDNLSYERKNLTIWASFDGGKTWPVKKKIYDGFSAYSSIATCKKNQKCKDWIYILYEAGEKKEYEYGYISRFKLNWLLSGELTGDGKLPVNLKF